MLSSPFHVRYGKLKVLKSFDKTVILHVIKTYLSGHNRGQWETCRFMHETRICRRSLLSYRDNRNNFYLNFVRRKTLTKNTEVALP